MSNSFLAILLKIGDTSGLHFRGVAQLARVRGLGPWGRRFESFHPDQYANQSKIAHFENWIPLCLSGFQRVLMVQCSFSPCIKLFVNFILFNPGMISTCSFWPCSCRFSKNHAYKLFSWAKGWVLWSDTVQNWRVQWYLESYPTKRFPSCFQYL